MEETKPRRTRRILSDKIDRGSPAFRIIEHLGGLSPTAELIGRSVHTVYGWLQRGIIPAGQQPNVREKAAEAGKDFPADWFTERTSEIAATKAA